MNLQSTINHLENCIVQEIQANRDAIKWIDSMEAVIAANKSSEFVELSRAGAQICRTGDKNSRRRQSYIVSLAKTWGLAADTLTLGSVARRLGAPGARLNELRSELRQVLGDLVRRQRRLAALIGMHRRINADVMQLILGCESHEQVNQGGSLVNAEA